MSETRPTVEVTLPDSKIRIVFNAFLTVGERRAVKRLTFSSLNIEVDEKKKTASVDKINGGFIGDSLDLTLKYLVREAYDEDGNKVSDPIAFINSLPSKYEPFIFDRVDEITAESVATEEVKKN